MFPSSIFSFSTWQRGGPALRRGLVRWPLYLIVLLLCGELVLRIPAVTAWLPEPEQTLWQATNVQTKVSYLQGLASAPGVDVLFVGNSTVLAGMDPTVFDQKRGVGPGSAVAFNGALEGLPAFGALTFVKVYARWVHPSVIIYGVTPQDLNENSPSVRSITTKLKESPLVIADTEDSLQARLLAPLLQYSNLFRYRLLLHKLLLEGGRIEPIKIYFDRRGFVASNHLLSSVSTADRSSYRNTDGVLNYSAKGEQVAALQDLILYCQDQHIKLVLVNMPLADDYFGNFAGSADYATYLSALEQTAARFQVPLWDMQAGARAQGFDDAVYDDFAHLNRFGADKLSSLLADRYTALIHGNGTAATK